MTWNTNDRLPYHIRKASVKRYAPLGLKRVRARPRRNMQKLVRLRKNAEEEHKRLKETVEEFRVFTTGNPEAEKLLEEILNG